MRGISDAASCARLLIATGFLCATAYAGHAQEAGESEEPAVAETVLIADRPGPPVEVSWELALEGGDYDSGLTNPALSGIGYTECRVICQLDDRCKAYTHDTRNAICTLKNSAGPKKPMAEARSGVFVDKTVVAQSSRVERTGSEPGFDDTLTWHGDDTAESYVERTRAAAVPFGGACDHEMAALDALKSAIRVDAPTAGVAGQTLEVKWAGNVLTERIPAWIVLSTPSRVRFSGKGFYGLNAGALGPFGIETAKDDTRAFVSLYGRSAGVEGSVGLVPLLAGDVELKATLVGYVRACRQVVELSTQTFALDVQPGPPRIVLNNPYVPNAYEHQVKLDAFGRQVFYNKDRFLIVDAELGSEILERNGTDLSFSPTGRYVAVRNDDASDIIDVVDGALVARIGDVQSRPEDVTWFHHDSFVAVARGPWGSTWLGSTLNIQKPLYIYDPTAACCTLDDTGEVDVNLENGLVRIVGSLNGMAADLQEFDAAVDYPPTDPYEDKFGASSMIFLRALGTVSPIPNALGWNRVLPPGDSGLVVSDVVAGGPADAAPVDASELTETRGVVSLIKPDAPRPRGVDLTQFGFAIAPETPAKSRLSPRIFDDISWEDKDAEEAARLQIRNAITKELKKHKIRVDWMKPTGDFMGDINCDFIRSKAEAKPSELPGALTLVQHLDRPGGAVWVIRSQCRGGGTSASFLFKSALIVIDEKWSARHPLKESIVEEIVEERASAERAFYDNDFETKLIGDNQILFTMPGKGTIALFDLEKRAFIYEKQNLPRGDLLKDSHVGAYGKFILQVNAESSFALHRVADAKEALEGRQVDDETIFWTPDFRFDATPEGASFVQLRFGGQNGQYTFQQFDQRLRRAGLLDAVLKDELDDTAVAIGVPPRLTGKLAAEGAKIVGEATPTGASALKEIRLYQDGVLTDTFAAGVSGGAVAVSAQRLPGTRWVTLIAANQDGLVSLPIGRDLGADQTLTRTHLLAVGIDRYSEPRLPRLKFAARDATNLRAAIDGLAGKSIEVRDDSTIVLTDENATKQAILDAAARIVADTRPGDNAVISFSGHGLQGTDGRLYLGLSATSLGDVEGTALAWNDLAAVLSNAKGRVTVLLDACHAGTAGIGQAASNDAAVNAIRDTIPSGLTVLAASKGRQLSAEFASLDGGVFTAAVVLAIGKERDHADADHNGRIEVSELYRYVKDKVSSLRPGEQTPWLSRNQMIGDFAIF